MTSIIKANVITGYGAPVDLKNYSESNPFTVPNDGMVWAIANYRANSYCMVHIDGINLLQASTPSTGSNVGNIIICAPVFKGQTLYQVTDSQGYSGATYRPFAMA